MPPKPPKQKEKKKTDLPKTQRHLHFTDYPNSHTTPSSPFSPTAQNAAPHRSPSPTPARPSSSRSPSGTPARTLPCRCSRIISCTVSCEGDIPRGQRRGAALSMIAKVSERALGWGGLDNRGIDEAGDRGVDRKENTLTVMVISFFWGAGDSS